MLAIQSPQFRFGDITFETQIKKFRCDTKISLSGRTRGSTSSVLRARKDQVKFYELAAWSCIRLEVICGLQRCDTMTARSFVF